MVLAGVGPLNDNSSKGSYSSLRRSNSWRRALSRRNRSTRRRSTRDRRPERLLAEMPERAPGQAVVNVIGLPGHSGKRRGTGHLPVADLIGPTTAAIAGRTRRNWEHPREATGRTSR